MGLKEENQKDIERSGSMSSKESAETGVETSESGKGFRNLPRNMHETDLKFIVGKQICLKDFLKFVAAQVFESVNRFIFSSRT
jgi:hypothetical protein